MVEPNEPNPQPPATPTAPPPTTAVTATPTAPPKPPLPLRPSPLPPSRRPRARTGAPSSRGFGVAWAGLIASMRRPDPRHACASFSQRAVRAAEHLQGRPSQQLRGEQGRRQVQGRRLLGHHGQGRARPGHHLRALSTTCTHLGCTPNWLEAEKKFKCPCHGSGFKISGVNFEGPAPRPLERYAIRETDDGQIVVDKSRKFQNELGQWDDPDSYVLV